jgi:hypothetical protein
VRGHHQPLELPKNPEEKSLAMQIAKARFHSVSWGVEIDPKIWTTELPLSLLRSFPLSGRRKGRIVEQTCITQRNWSGSEAL